MALDEQQPVAAITPTERKRTLADGTMSEKFDRLTEQVAVLSALPQVQQSQFANQRQPRNLTSAMTSVNHLAVLTAASGAAGP